MVTRTHKAQTLSQRPNTFEAANAQYAFVNCQIIQGTRQLNVTEKALRTIMLRVSKFFDFQ